MLEFGNKLTTPVLMRLLLFLECFVRRKAGLERDPSRLVCGESLNNIVYRRCKQVACAAEVVTMAVWVLRGGHPNNFTRASCLKSVPRMLSFLLLGFT